MKKRSNVSFFCQACGHEEKKWHGRCPSCNEWNSLVEEKISATNFGTALKKDSDNKPKSILEISSEDHQRVPFGIDELDRVLGGGLVHGSVSLIGGEPGAGKSTLLQIASSALAKKGCKVLYISGEESKEQIRLNAERLDAVHENVFLLSENSIEDALTHALNCMPDFLVVDSVQTLQSANLDSASGSVAQIREVCAKVVNFAKSSGVPIFLVGHVTKDGAIAGPRLLEHMVDTVLYFEQSRGDHYRLLRAHKNRFGSTNEIGLFEMSAHGLFGINNPSQFFLSERPENKPGSTVFCAMEGTRPLLVEVQALAVECAFGNPRRTCVGIDANRCSIIAALLEKHANLPLSRIDLFVSIAGGMDIKEPSLDLALGLAIASSLKNQPLPYDLVCMGELGLSGEIRNVHRINDRLNEASRLGFKKGIIPHPAIKHLDDNFSMRLKGPKTIEEAIRVLIE